ncbi:hypothetical protein [Paenibacillus sp. FSL R7-0337]|uniref:hypothetical protein n=1 Tax=Paenibacillus sp. FSL R7-0337 TaxID=1926588 RepID=UPI00096FC537|nr:hypothetical protein [Paenibacillus sp. FSL R7-0337]OMF88748.1 hypothetical protein BK147_26450 [Paenibacillus sp. FSL R7-0337]
MRFSTYQEYQRPTPDDSRFLEGEYLENLDHEEVLELADAPYCDKNWARLVYSLINHSLLMYSDDYFSDLIEKTPVISDSSEEIMASFQSSIKCLIFYTNVQTPLYYACEMKFCQGTDLFGGVGIYKIHSKLGFNEEMIQRAVTRVIQYSLESCNPFRGLTIAVVQPDGSWKMVLVQIKIPTYLLRESDNTVTAMIHVFDPDRFVRMILGGVNPKEVTHLEFKSIFQVAGSLQHFK